MPINISVNPEVMENIHIGASCSSDEIQTYTTLFQEFCDVFAWSYKEMPGIDPQIVIHKIKTYPEAKPVRKSFILFIHEKSLLLKPKLKNFLKQVLFILYL
jgi:hypothetical protein